MRALAQRAERKRECRRARRPVSRSRPRDHRSRTGPSRDDLVGLGSAERGTAASRVARPTRTPAGRSRTGRASRRGQPRRGPRGRRAQATTSCEVIPAGLSASRIAVARADSPDAPPAHGTVDQLAGAQPRSRSRRAAVAAAAERAAIAETSTSSRWSAATPCCGRGARRAVSRISAATFVPRPPQMVDDALGVAVLGADLGEVLGVSTRTLSRPSSKGRRSRAPRPSNFELAVRDALVDRR